MNQRSGKEVQEWIDAELEAVWVAAAKYALEHCLTVPTLKQVEEEERQAQGHIDYGAQWAYGVARHMKKVN